MLRCCLVVNTFTQVRKLIDVASTANAHTVAACGWIFMDFCFGENRNLSRIRSLKKQEVDVGKEFRASCISAKQKKRPFPNFSNTAG